MLFQENATRREGKLRPSQHEQLKISNTAAMVAPGKLSEDEVPIA